MEEKDATPEERLIQEVNAGIYCFDSGFLFSALPKLSRKNRQGEYYLTDVIQLARESGHSVSVLFYPQSEEVLGINDRKELARTGQILRRQINEEWMKQGVTLLDPENTYIESTVKIGPDTTIGPFTLLSGRTRIGARCLVSSQVILENAVLDEGVQRTAFFPYQGSKEGSKESRKINDTSPRDINIEVLRRLGSGATACSHHPKGRSVKYRDQESLYVWDHRLFGA